MPTFELLVKALHYTKFEKVGWHTKFPAKSYEMSLDSPEMVTPRLHTRWKLRNMHDKNWETLVTFMTSLWNTFEFLACEKRRYTFHRHGNGIKTWRVFLRNFFTWAYNSFNLSTGHLCFCDPVSKISPHGLSFGAVHGSDAASVVPASSAAGLFTARPAGWRAVSRS